MARYDPAEDNQAPATALWQLANCQLPSSFLGPLLVHLGSEAAEVRTQAAAALAAAIGEHPSTVGEALTQLIASYTNAPVAARLGAAAGLMASAAVLGHKEVTAAMDFLIRNGLADEDAKVREAMVAAGSAIVDVHGGALAPQMLPLFEGFLEKNKGMGADAEARYDLVREGVVVFLGTLARHLPPEDPKRSAIVQTLLDVLGTPSESVQRSVSTCLAPLIQPMSSNREYVEGLVSRLMETLTKATSFGERRGAAFGLAGLVKGLGIMAMKNYNIMDSLKTAVEDKKEANAREGALLAFECLSEKLGKLFEPYIIYILPLLLNCFGDVVPHVRQATEDASRMIMGQLTASGVKLVLPSLLKGLEDKVWRTKQGSVQLLGAMAHCAPKQLGSCLPTIVPRLGDVLGDPHPKVQSAAQEALNEIGSVIRNPEVQSLVPHLLAAIADPNGKTRPCLDVLLETVFVNTIDAPSLALIVPVVYRGLRDRMGDTKRRAARIVGNMCTLINDPKDMTPYVPLLMPELQKSLVDPLPEVRAVSARAMGSLLKGMGTETFADLVPWLMATLRSDGSSVERSGAAQGLAEVLSVLGTSHLELLLPDIMDGCKNRAANVREGHLTLFQFLPVTLESLFQPYLGRVLPSILDGLADESEGVRDAALMSGRVFVDHYANSALKLLLPAVEDGIFDDNWRIRQSSALLLGKLLFKVVGTSGNIVLDGGSDDEGAAEEHYGEAIIAALGMERRNQVLSRLYVCRSDPQYSVRSEALHVWKTIVVNTPKTLQQLLPVLMQQVISSLASDSEDRRTMAARCMGELCRKMGERVLARIVPILKEGIKSPEGATRQGVCLGLKEVLENISKHQLADHLADVLSTVQAALTDSDARVREAAGEAFAILFKGGAGSAVESVVPSMIQGLESPKHYAESLEGLRVIQLVRPTIFNFVVPKLMRTPLQLHNIRALAVLATSAGHTLNAHIGNTLPKLLTLASQPHSEAEEDESKEAAAAEAAASIALSVQEDGLHLLISEMLHGLEDPARRLGTAHLIKHFAARSKVDFQEKVATLLDAVVALLGEEKPEVLQGLWKAMEALASTIPKEEHHQYVRPLKEAVATATEKERRKRRAAAAAAGTAAAAAAIQSTPLLVAGFCLPKALAPVLPIYLAGVLQGSSTEVREQAAEGLGELVEVTGEEALKPFVVQITGPLIRIIGDRFPSQVKAAILLTLGLLIRKAGAGLKPFVPQLQTTFLKCLTDASEVVRERAAKDLGELSRMSARVDQLAADLASSARAAEPLIRDSYLMALSGLLHHSGERVSPAVLATLGDTLREMLRAAAAAPEGEEGDGFRSALATCLGAHARHGGPDQLRSTLTAGPLSPGGGRGSDAERLLHAMVLAAAMGQAGAAVSGAGLLRQVGEAIQRFAKDPDGQIKAAAGRAAARLAAADASTMAGGLTMLVALLGPDQNSGVHQQALMSLRKLAEADVAALQPHLPTFMPSLCALMGTTSGPTRQACERTVKQVLQLGEGLEVAQSYLETGPGPVVKAALTEATLRRLQKLSDEDDFFTAEDY